MVGHFVSLKLRLLRNGLLGNRRRITALIAAVLVTLPLAALGFLGLASMRSKPAGRYDVAVLGFALLFLAWIVLPLLSFGSDETLDPSRLALLPLRTFDMISGLLAASCVGVAPIASVIALAGAVVGYTHGLASYVIVPLAAFTELALCVLASRAVTTTMAGLLRSRKARDLSVVFVALLGLGFRVAAQFSSVVFEPKHRAAVDGVARWVALTPPGLAGRAVAQAAAGHTASASLALVGAVLFAALIGWCWWAALDRLMTTADSSGPRRQASAGRVVRGALFGRFLTWLPATRTGAVAAKELRYAARDPRRRAQLISYLPIMAFPLFGLFASGGTGSRTLLTMPLIAFFLAGSLDNQFGLDGGAHAMHLLAGNDPAADMRGKCLAALVMCGPIVLPLLVLVAALSGGWGLLVPAILLTAGFVGVLAGVGCVISVRAPQALATGKNPWASRGAGTGCANGLLSLSGILVQGALCLPFAIVLTLVRDSVPAVFAVSIAAAGYGVVIWRIGLNMATRWVWWRLPELLTLISPKAAT